MVSSTQTSASIRADYMIHQRRAREAYVDDLNQHLAADYKLRHKAQWEQKTDKFIVQGTLNNRVSQLRQLRQEQLENRRRQLAELLASEQEGYRQEYIARQETPEEIRQRMADRLHFLKSERENQRQEDVQAKIKQRWKESADELRTQDSKLGALHCRIEQENQMNERIQREIQEREDQKIYDELWRREKVKKDLAEAQKVKKKEELNLARMTYLGWQKDLRQNQREKSLQEQEEERKMLNLQWTIEKQKEKAVQAEKDRIVRERNQEIIQHNEFNKQLKLEELEREKELDKQMIQQTILREKAEELRELQEKERVRKQAQELSKHYGMRAEQQQELERRIEQYAQMEYQQQQRALEQKWRKEEQARIQLLYDVYNSRYDAIRARKQREQEEKEEDLQEKKRIEEYVKQTEEMDRNRRENIRMNKVAHQEDLSWQMQEKEKRRLRELQEDMNEQRAARMAEIQYQRMIEEERKRGMALLDELRAKRPY